MGRKAFLCFFIVFNAIFIYPAWGQSFSQRSYLKDLRSLQITNADSIQVVNLLHNRFNGTFRLNDQFSFHGEMRNRLYYGNLPASASDLVKDMSSTDDYFTWSSGLVRRENFVLHTMIDRLFAEISLGNTEIRLGRQRVNWGNNLFWNPNDFFNTYSFYDFDYEERPGSDALMVRHHFGFASSVEMVAKMADSWDNAILASRFSFNFKGYDVHLSGGMVKKELVAGIGWSGHIGNAGFKGECSYFAHRDKPSVVVASLGSDYSFTSKFFLNVEALYTSNGKSRLGIMDFMTYTARPLSPETLSPVKYTAVVQPVYNINPRHSASSSVVYFFGENAVYLLPTYSVNLVSNIDLDFIGQLILSRLTGEYKFNQKTITLRLKWSF